MDASTGSSLPSGRTRTADSGPGEGASRARSGATTSLPAIAKVWSTTTSSRPAAGVRCSGTLREHASSPGQRKGPAPPWPAPWADRGGRRQHAAWLGTWAHRPPPTAPRPSPVFPLSLPHVLPENRPGAERHAPTATNPMPPNRTARHTSRTCVRVEGDTAYIAERDDGTRYDALTLAPRGPHDVGRWVRRREAGPLRLHQRFPAGIGTVEVAWTAP
jgi:hypothetical protein